MWIIFSIITCENTSAILKAEGRWLQIWRIWNGSPRETYYFFTTELSQLILFKIWSFHGGDYEECRLLGYKNPVRTWRETHYVSTTEHSQLMLCKIWGFHGGDYEECRLLGYKNPVGTSQETHYFSATEPSQLMLCKIWGFHGSKKQTTCSWVRERNIPTQRPPLVGKNKYHLWGIEGCRVVSATDPVRSLISVF
jgi:hypothetical protein